MQVPGDGRMLSFVFFAGRTGEIKIQVWRPKGGVNFQLVDMITYNVRYVGIHYAELPRHKQIIVKKGDYFGWRHTGKGIFEFDSDTSGSRVRYLYGNPIWRGQTGTFSSQVRRKYSFRTFVEVEGA